MRVNRYVLDANIWVSYIITQTENRLLNQVAEGNLTIFICAELLQEVERVLKYPQLKQYGINVPIALKFVKKIGVYCELTYPIKRYITDDPEDDYIVALALQTNSGFITSGGQTYTV